MIRSWIAASALLMLVSSVEAQESESDYCGFTDSAQTAIEAIVQTGGAYITAEDTVRCLFVFIDFFDDTVDTNNAEWPLGDGPSYIDEYLSSCPGQHEEFYNITNYFEDMSFGNFQLVGEAHYMQAPSSLSNYISTYGTNIPYHATKDVLIALDDSVNYFDYDNWKRDDVYDHSNDPDSVVDMIFAVYRRWYEAPGFNALGWATLKWGTGSDFTLKTAT